jgi:apolipoprotein N-acyltransferase
VNSVSALGGAILSGVAIALCFPSPEASGLAWIAVIPLLAALRRRSGAACLGLGFLTGFVFNALYGLWGPTSIGWPRYVSLVTLSGLWVAAFAWGTGRIRHRAPGWAPLGIALLWGILEWARVHAGFLAIPTGLLGYTQYDQKGVVSIAAVTGIWGISLALIATNAALEELLDARRSAHPIAWPGVLASGALALALLISGAWLGAPPKAERRLRVALVQAGVHLPGDHPGSGVRRVFERYRRLTLEVARQKPVLIVWPESSVAAALPADRAAREAMAALARESGAHLVIGTSGRDKFGVGKGGGWANSIFHFSPEGEILGRYDKIRLLPFNEYVPARSWIDWPEWIVTEMVDARAGDAVTQFQVEGERVGVLICWENLFPADFRRRVADGADFVLSATSEAFDRHGSAREQLAAINAVRAAENGVAIVRAATTGVSAIIDPDGGIAERVADSNGRYLDVEGAIVREIPIGSSSTPYRRMGDWLPVGETMALAGLLVAGRSQWRGEAS